MGSGLLPSAGDTHVDDAGGLAPTPRGASSAGTTAPADRTSPGSGEETERQRTREEHASPRESPSPTAEETPSRPASEPPEESAGETSADPEPTAEPSSQEPEPTEAPTQEETGAPDADPESAAVLQVLSLVNAERGQAGCQPLTLDAQLGALAQDFSEDMAARGFFDHTDPDGLTPWDRAQVAGIGNLGGENIARGQQDAQAVMDAWMGSEGHRANILNCEFRTLGVGVHFGTGGPWWTQDFGY
ncbi:CAP domain-containing protein [Streptomyces hoynatensis]|uniref:CAP domain-containing protein n=1 Tax=Streptomyces hoynatensis TaxID=1141874 RepID=UPI001F4D4052|nr:CAP domain-containing protein [Streptomyces hoynatensis]